MSTSTPIDPTYSEYETSYTKSVVDELSVYQSRYVTPRHFDTFERAINLLREYHRTQHVVYEKLDAANARIKELEPVTLTQVTYLSLEVAALNRQIVLDTLAKFGLSRVNSLSHDQIKPYRTALLQARVDYLQGLLDKAKAATA